MGFKVLLHKNYPPLPPSAQSNFYPNGPSSSLNHSGYIRVGKHNVHRGEKNSFTTKLVVREREREREREKGVGLKKKRERKRGKKLITPVPRLHCPSKY